MNIVDDILSSPHGLTIAVHLFVTDADRNLPLRGDTRVAQATNYAEDIAAARRERLVTVLTDFCERANATRPAFADERALDYVRHLIDQMIHEGALSYQRRDEMLAGARLSKDGGVTGEIVGMLTLHVGEPTTLPPPSDTLPG